MVVVVKNKPIMSGRLTARGPFGRRAALHRCGASAQELLTVTHGGDEQKPRPRPPFEKEPPSI
eukprot:8771761-Pyramimonas_sp.AAC.1